MTIEERIEVENVIILFEELPFLRESFGGKMRGLAFPLALTSPIGILIKMALHRSKARKILEQGSTRCDRLTGNKKKKCLQDVKKVFAENNIRELEKVKRECGKQSTPEKIKNCNERIDQKIAIEKEKIIRNRRMAGIFQATAEFGH